MTLGSARLGERAQWPAPVCRTDASGAKTASVIRGRTAIQLHDHDIVWQASGSEVRKSGSFGRAAGNAGTSGVS